MTRKNYSHSTQDEYATPMYAVDIVSRYVPAELRVWCPFDKPESNYVKRFNTPNYTHIDSGEDFLTYTPDFDYDIIVGNPPFSIKNEVLARCIQLDKPFALLLPFTMFNSIRAVKTISKTRIQFLIIDKRISFNGDRPNFSCWYVCRDVLPEQVMFHFIDEDPRQLTLEEK